jgi:hypothetical protein
MGTGTLSPGLYQLLVMKSLFTYTYCRILNCKEPCVHHPYVFVSCTGTHNVWIFMMQTTAPGGTYHSILNEVCKHNYDFALLLPDHAPEICHSGCHWCLTCYVEFACILGSLKLASYLCDKGHLTSSSSANCHGWTPVILTFRCFPHFFYANT